MITMEHICKTYRIAKRNAGFAEACKSLFHREYEEIHALSDLSFTIGDGEMVGYIGPNGAGKSSTIKILSGILTPDSGSCIVDGRVPWKDRTAYVRGIGVVFGQRSQLWWSLPLIESFKLLKDIYRVGDAEYNGMMDMYRELVDIEKLLHKPVRQMSLGQRTLSDILAAFLHDPKIVFLDEPTIGLDVSMKAKIRELIHALNKEKNTTVILTTHDMGDVDALCRRIVIIDKGKMLYDNDIEHLKSFFGSYRTLKIRVDGENSVENVRAELPDFMVSDQDEWVSVLVDEEKTTVMDVLNRLIKTLDVRDMRLEEISTEDVIKKIYEEGAA